MISVDPLWVIIAVAVWGVFAGLAGMFIARGAQNVKIYGLEAQNSVLAKALGESGHHRRKLRDEIADLEERKDAAYLERNRVVALLASLFPSGIGKTAIPGWPEDWHSIVYIDLPCGQASWHYHDSHARLFEHLPPYTKAYDGHTTEQKYQRIAEFAKGAAP